MPIIATAGHVDHGKSTLVQALTGRDPDRWSEEKERGLTIDLGFAWTELDGHPVGFVDVPGHERFIKNMLAGVGGLDVALLVVAADEGWMPQTEEHVAVLDLLEVHHAVVALTRVDVADTDVAELAALEIEEQLEGTTLEGSPIVPVSAIAGTGMDTLRSALAAALDQAGEPRDIGRPRLWVDRSFTISGAGTVVTGTLVDGSFQVGDQVELIPGPLAARIRTLQSHETEVDAAAPGSRVAANMGGLDRTDVARGALLTKPGLAIGSTRFLASVRPVRTVEEIADRGAYQLHAGSGAWPVRVRNIDHRTTLLTSEEPIPLVAGDRYVLRETGRRAVVGGGQILDPRPPQAKGQALGAAADELRESLEAGPDMVATTLLHIRGVATRAELEIDSGGGAPGDAITGGVHVAAPEHATELLRRIGETVTGYHEANPLRPGVPKATLSSSLGVHQLLLEAILAGAKDLVDEGATVRSTDHGASWSDADEAAWEGVAAELRAAGTAAPRASQLGLRDELLHAALREGRLIRVETDLVYLPETIEHIKDRLQQLPTEFTVADFRDAMDISRRQAVPLLEWLDANAVTTRRGDVRTLRQSPLQ